MKTSHIRYTVLCLITLTSAQAQSSQTDRLSGNTGAQIAHSESWLQWQHMRSLFPKQNNFTPNPYLDAWAERSTSLSYTRVRMQQLLQRERTSIDRERMRLAIALDYLEDAQELLLSESRLSERVQTAYRSASSYLEQTNPIGLIGKEHTQWLVARGYVAMSLARPNLKAAQALLTKATEHNNQWGERALLYLAMLEHAQGKPDIALRLLDKYSWSQELAPEALYQKILISQDTDTPEQIIREIQRATRLYPQLSKRQRIQGTQGIAYYRLRDWSNTLRALKPLSDQEKLSLRESYALGAAYYAVERYTEAAPLLEQVATKSSGELALVAELALGNIYTSLNDHKRAKLAYTSVVEGNTTDLPSSVVEEALYRLIELNFSSGSDAFGRQTRLVERFLITYPKSQYEERVLQLLRHYCHTSTDYEASLQLLQSLSYKEVHLGDVRQEVLVRYANTLGDDTPQYAQLLEEAIALGPGRASYPMALLMLGQHQLERQNYQDAEHSLRLALEQKPWGEAYGSGLGHYLLGYTLYNQKRYAEAFRSFARYSQGNGEINRRAKTLTRMGDCLLSEPKRYTEALKYYEEAIGLDTKGIDEAHRRIVSIYGLMGQYRKQTIEADRFTKAYPQSVHLPEVQYLKAKALSLSEGYTGKDEAHRIYSQVESQYPSSPYAPLSALERALLYATESNYEHAVPAYKRVVELYPTSTEARTALSDLKTLYAELDQMDKYVEYASRIEPSRLPDEHNMEELNFHGIQARLRRNQEGAIDELKRWTESHPHSPQLYEAQKLLAETYYQKKQYTEAITLLSKMEQSHTASVQQLHILELLGQAHRAIGNQAEMLQAYRRAYGLAVGDALRRRQLAEVLSSEAYAAAAYQLAVEVVTEELRSTALPTACREALTLIKGKAQEQLKALKGAIQTYATLEGSYMSLQGAEAAVRRAEIMLHLGQSKAAERLLEQFVESGTPQRYWLARGFITLSDCHAAQGDHYLAAQYLKNLRDTYDNPEEDITVMITTRLNKSQE
ncbi:MAG: tetratricopeptide repeat protein [Porphyromonadaceae bacterium]|nr:tetratricopeptide repeat protein [Porphyromonadaceae bacterium]